MTTMDSPQRVLYEVRFTNGMRVYLYSIDVEHQGEADELLNGYRRYYVLPDLAIKSICDVTDWV